MYKKSMIKNQDNFHVTSNVKIFLSDKYSNWPEKKRKREAYVPLRGD